MSLFKQALSAVRRILIVLVIAAVFLFGLATTVILSLRSPVVKVPEVIGKDRFEAESILHSAGLNFRVRASRPSGQAKPDIVLFQLPRAGEDVKEGQTVAVDVSRAAKEGEVSEPAPSENKANNNTNSNTNSNNANSPAHDNTVNENKPPKRNKNTNNANGNTNANANGNTNRHRSGNANDDENGNGNGSNRNENRRPPVETPTPRANPSSSPPGF